MFMGGGGRGIADPYKLWVTISRKGETHSKLSLISEVVHSQPTPRCLGITITITPGYDVTPYHQPISCPDREKGDNV